MRRRIYVIGGACAAVYCMVGVAVYASRAYSPVDISACPPSAVSIQPGNPAAPVECPPGTLRPVRDLPTAATEILGWPILFAVRIPYAPQIATWLWTRTASPAQPVQPLGEEIGSSQPVGAAASARIYSTDVASMSFDDQMRYCEAILDGTDITVRPTTRAFIHLPQASFADYDANMRGWRTVSGDATAGHVSNGGWCAGDDVKPGCWSCLYQFEGNGVVEFTATSTEPGGRSYHVRVTVDGSM